MMDSRRVDDNHDWHAIHIEISRPRVWISREELCIFILWLIGTARLISVEINNIVMIAQMTVLLHDGTTGITTMSEMDANPKPPQPRWLEE